ncbi:MAG: hypothetical protein K0S65_3262 [Labilithrix sp.]|nr:hypothetical protein [Labilithrix sp.]
MSRVIYEGSGISIADSDYTHGVPNPDDPEDFVEGVELEGLDERVTRAPVLRFVLDYPFPRPYEGKVISDSGATLRQIIDAVRQGFRVMYRGAREQDIPNLENKLVDGDYGRAYHVIGDLVIESIEIDDGTGELTIFIGS